MQALVLREKKVLWLKSRKIDGKAKGKHNIIAFCGILEKKH